MAMTAPLRRRIRPGWAVEAARGEAVGVGLIGMMRRQPVDEVAGTIGHGAHPSGADVQAMGVIGGGIGHARTEGVAALDQDGGLVALGQTRGQHGPGKTAADDDHGEGGGGVVHGLTSPEARGEVNRSIILSPCAVDQISWLKAPISG